MSRAGSDRRTAADKLRRLLRTHAPVSNALILDADFYETPYFSTDGHFLAIRGNAYGQTLDVFEFPTLHEVLHDTRRSQPRRPIAPE